MREINSADLGFEEKIWKAARILQGNMDAMKHMYVVLGLIFLKYISDRFEEKYTSLETEGKGFEEDRDEYLADGVFYIPASARWDVIAAKSNTPNIGAFIDKAIQEIETENLHLKDILPENFASQEIDQRRLGEVVDLFTNIKMADHGESKDNLRRTYEYCLSMFAEQSVMLRNELYTPACVVKTLVEVLQPCKGRVYDPCCGIGGMFVQSAKFIEDHQGNINNISMYGQELNSTTWKIAQMNMAIHGIEADLGKFSADTFYNDLHPTLKADFVMANPPFNLSDWGADKLADDVRWMFGIPPRSNANFAWMQHMIHHLTPQGRLALVMTNGSLSSQLRGEGEIRKNIVEADLVECIVAMPPQLFYSTSLPMSLWFINMNKKQKNKTVFIDARELGTMKSRKLRELTTEDIERIGKTVSAFEEGTLEDKAGFCAVVSTESIAKQKYNLTPGRYVGFGEVEEEDEEPFEKKVERLRGELTKLFAESRKAEVELHKQLKSIGFEV